MVGIIRHQAPGVLRGQLSDSYRSYRHDGTHPSPGVCVVPLFWQCLGPARFLLPGAPISATGLSAGRRPGRDAGDVDRPAGT